MYTSGDVDVYEVRLRNIVAGTKVQRKRPYARDRVAHCSDSGSGFALSAVQRVRVSVLLGSGLG